MTTSNSAEAEEKDDSFTAEERLQWLRDHGVVVETPEDRQQASVAAARTGGTSATTTTTPPATAAISHTQENSINYVYIPADQAKPLQDCQLVLPASSDDTNNNTSRYAWMGDPLANYLKTAFATNADQFDINLFRKTQRDHPIHQFVAGGGGGGGEGGRTEDITTVVSNETLQETAHQGHVETFVLVHPTSSNNNITVTFYLDEIGQLKRLPLNLRATELAKVAGYNNPPPIFHGDIFLARSCTSSRYGGCGWRQTKYLDITVSECRVDALWLQQAARDNTEHQLQVNARAGIQQQQQQQPSVVGSDGVAKVEEEKGYSWTQSEEEVELVVPLTVQSDTTVSVKDISVTFKPRTLQVKIKHVKMATTAPAAAAAADGTILSMHLFERVNVDGCTWTMDKGQSSNNNNYTLVLTLEKAEEAMWPRLEY
jgi:hypothetical protein